ncbi:MAG TPA: serine/threonine protein kinase, partial [Rhodoglobus sp.]|nr:serine/threonine protein kinase [Rhodoglobus sp.]
AVPGVLGAGAAATTALPAAGIAAPTQATQLLPSAVPVATSTAPVETEESKRSPWMWWLIALIALLAVVLIGVLVAIFANPDRNGGNTPTSSAPPASSARPTSPTPTATPSGNDRVALNLDDIVGRDQATVEAYLGELGLGFNPVTGQVAPSEEEVGLAYAANPTGNVRRGEVITVQFYAEIPAPEATKPATGSITEPAPYEVGDTVTFTWPAYNGCPADHPLSGFSISVQGATGTTSVGSGTSSTQIALDQAGDVTVTYTALCTDFESPPSDPTTITVTE